MKSSRILRVITRTSLLLAFIMPFTWVFYEGPSQGDMFGGDDFILTQILANALQQLAQLQSILGTGQDTLGLMRDINRGINDSLSLIQTVGPGANPGIYGDWTQVNTALVQLQALYGDVAGSPNAQLEQNTDQTVAEAIDLNNSVHQYASSVDTVGEAVKSDSHDVSPSGAAKLTAESLGVEIEVLTESLRTQGTSLKLQAQDLETQNHKDKAMSRHIMETSESLHQALGSEPTDFTIPRF